MSIYLNSPRTVWRVILDILNAYFYPITRHFRHDIRIERIYNFSKSERSFRSSAYDFAGCIARYNQGAIIDYVFSLAERHKALRLSLDDGNDIDERRDDLLKSMNLGFFKSVSHNFEFLHDHFKDRSSISPHISIRGNWRTQDRNKIITIFRDRKIFGDAEFDIAQSTAISFCASTGRPYLCNDIPRAVIESDYLSPLFRSIEARNLLLSQHFPFRRRLLQKEWLNLWNFAEKNPDCAYRSNLTIPIMIEKSRLSNETVKKFRAESADKLIFGYLCFDHHIDDYFDYDLDVPIVKMVADIISIFSFQRLRFTDFSTTFDLSSTEAVKAESAWTIDYREELSNILRVISKGENTTDRAREVEGQIDENIALVNADDMILHMAEDSPVILDGVADDAISKAGNMELR
jgi:hypothetical protein